MSSTKRMIRKGRYLESSYKDVTHRNISTYMFELMLVQFLNSHTFELILGPIQEHVFS